MSSDFKSFIKATIELYIFILFTSFRRSKTESESVPEKIKNEKVEEVSIVTHDEIIEIPGYFDFLDKISNLHSGYRTVLIWYMWRSIDRVDVSY